MSETARFTWLIPGLGCLACLGAFTNDFYLPSLSLVADGLNADPGSVQLTTTAVFIGFSIGALFHGPLSDRFGRKPVLCFGLGGYAVGGLFAAAAQSLEALIVARVIQGAAVSATMVLTRAIILDRWSGAEASRVISWIGIFVFMAPVLAPLLGGYTAGFGYWPAVFWVQGAVGLIALTLTLLLLSRSRSSRTGGIFSGIRSYAVALSSSSAVGYMLCTGLAFVGLVTFISTSSIVFVDYYGLTPAQQGICFSIVMTGAAVSSFLNGRLVTRLGISTMIGFGTACLALGGTLVLLACITEARPAILVAAVMVYIFGVGFIFSNTVARTMSYFKEHIGAVSSAFTASQYLIGALVTAGLSSFSTPGLLPLGITFAAAGLANLILWWGWLRNSAFTRRASGNAA